jgi:hypothetical protein
VDAVDGHAQSSSDPERFVDAHRRSAAYLYGLVVSGAVLAAASASASLVGVAGALFGTLLIYWAAETYVHWMATRTVLRRSAPVRSRRRIVVDGWPLVSACTIPVVVLLAEAWLGVETLPAVRVALLVNAALLLLVGYAMSRAGGLTGWRLVVSVSAAGLLGLAVVGLKTLLH